MNSINNKNFKIFTFDSKGNLSVGHLEIKDYNMLFLLRNLLLRNIDISFKRTGKNSYEPFYLNTALIFTSLLGNLDEDKLGFIAKRLVNNGSLKLAPLSDIWGVCSKGLIESMESQNEDNHKDYEIFSEVLENGAFIEYVVDDVIEVNCIRESGIFNEGNISTKDKSCTIGNYFEYNKEFFEQVKYNSLIFGTCKHKGKVMIKK